MKRSVCLILLFLCVALGVAQNTIVVIGEVKEVKDGTEFLLEETNGVGSSSMYWRDMDENNGKVIDGKFVLEYRCANIHSRHFALFSDSQGFFHEVSLEFWANPGDTVYVKGKGALLGTWEVRTKAPEQKELDAIRKACAKELAAYQQAQLDYEAYRWYRRDTEMTEVEWDSTGVVLACKDSLKLVTRKKWNTKQLEVMKNLPVTDFWMYQMGTILRYAKFYRADFEGIIKELYIQHADKIDRKPDGKAVKEWVYPYPKAKLGESCTDGDLFDVNGKKYRLADFRGKYVLMDFWANHCGACIEALLHLGKLQEKYADKLVLVSLSVDKVSSWKTSKFLNEFTWLNLNDGGGHDGGLAGSYDIRVLPTYILIAPDGTYKARLNSADLEDGKLEKYLSE